MSDDPYLAFEPQNNDIQEYPANIGIYFWLFLSFIGIGVGATSIILSIQDQTLWPALFAIAITVLIIFSISYMPKSIICTKDEIIIRYWLKKSTKKIPWKNIYGLRIKIKRGYWGHIN
jgi:hypothetical protein